MESGELGLRSGEQLDLPLVYFPLLQPLVVLALTIPVSLIHAFAYAVFCPWVSAYCEPVIN